MVPIIHPAAQLCVEIRPRPPARMGCRLKPHHMLAAAHGIAPTLLARRRDRWLSEAIWADARLLRLGRRMAVCDVRLWTESADRIAAQATVTYSLP